MQRDFAAEHARRPVGRIIVTQRANAGRRLSELGVVDIEIAGYS
jgi:hypothetical protein